MSNQNWETPIDLYAKICKKLHLNPTLDVCASEQNAKCGCFRTELQNGLAGPWHITNWCNPPYEDVWAWFAKGIRECKEQGSTTIFLTHYTLESKGMEEVWPFVSRVLLVAPRINFYDPVHPFKKGNDRPSMITVIEPRYTRRVIERWNYNKEI